MNITDIRKFFKGLTYAFKGIFTCIKFERNMRVHLCAAFYVLIFMRFYELSKAESAIVYLTIGAVIALEMLNTAVEAVVDLCSPQYHKLAKVAKDTAAGAVLVCAITSLAVAAAIFWDIDVFKKIYGYFAGNVYAVMALLVSFVLWFLFIFSAKKPPKSNNDKKKTLC